MLDARLKMIIDPIVGRWGKRLYAFGISANRITLAGLLIGVAAAVCIAYELYLFALLLMGLSRLMDGLDGAVARAGKKTDLGGYLDIVFDFIFYGLIPLAFAFARPENALPAAILLMAFYANGASFLAFAIMAEKRGLATDSHGSKSLYFTGGLAEAGETYIAFALFCLLPDWFGLIACIFAAMTAITTVSRILQAKILFGGIITPDLGESKATKAE
ncbi:CDP-alcohol phosphatidyltransferase family protein [uncultured Cohaesibacter sp.]|uniref:CDP-alcohol phosphatidyltransferase family protein n=1 Tax=uncultured Cohaesibacter sp. TaxID=1002546 RepID=UPI0029C61253|nr:CDP-alcohol phosphatidyltransferase family protein [uncultured Cohaesibacter sp.]